MRPGSSSRNNLTSSAGLPPQTGMRPGSGRKAPGTARMRTGIAPTGPGTQAAQGLALSASINVSDRPVTGQGVMGMRVSTQQTGRLVQDSAFYIGLLRTKVKEINDETIRLRSEVDQQSKDNSQYSQLERKYEALLKSKEQLEGQLADYNLALDKVNALFPFVSMYLFFLLF
jgi:intraflagellar transport protein 74